jgi:hypothetical protein
MRDAAANMTLMPFIVIILASAIAAYYSYRTTRR